MVSRIKASNGRVLSVLSFSFLFSYLMAFLFEGRVLYGLLEERQIEASAYVVSAIAAHFAGLICGGLFVKTTRAARRALILGMGICLPATAPFFFRPTALWLIGLVVSGLASGCSVASWGYLLKEFTPKNERIKTCADALICSNLLMILINVIAMKTAPGVGLISAMACMPAGMAAIWLLPDAGTNAPDEKPRPQGRIGRPLGILFLFVSVITVNSGLMYQVVNPAFERLALAKWYWAVPYIAAIAALRGLPIRNRSAFLYVGMAMMMGAFIGFMLLGNGVIDYLIVDTLLLGACGIFDLFWWSILGEMLDYTDNPAMVFGVGLSANVFGVLTGDLIGHVSTRLSGAEVAVIALVIASVTLIILPHLNRRLLLLLKSHTYLWAYGRVDDNTAAVRGMEPLDPLTGRESEVLALLLNGKSNRDISKELFISESTAKTHVRNIFSKYDVSSRAELISTLLRKQGRP